MEEVAAAWVDDGVATNPLVRHNVRLVLAAIAVREALFANIKIPAPAVATVVEGLFVEDIALASVTDYGHPGVGGDFSLTAAFLESEGADRLEDWSKQH